MNNVEIYANWCAVLNARQHNAHAPCRTDFNGRLFVTIVTARASQPQNATMGRKRNTMLDYGMPDDVEPPTQVQKRPRRGKGGATCPMLGAAGHNSSGSLPDAVPPSPMAPGEIATDAHRQPQPQLPIVDEPATSTTNPLGRRDKRRRHQSALSTSQGPNAATGSDDEAQASGAAPRPRSCNRRFIPK